jgi:regulator of protease activity HflC (stomatin/prohibitin superfamily)
MADDPTVDYATAPSPPPASPSVAPVAVATLPPETSYLQLTQTRVDLDDAGEAFTVPDASGRLPIVVLPKQPFRIRNEFVIAGIIAIVVGLVFDLQLSVRGGVIGIGVLFVFLGVFQSFLVAVPEGARALLLRSGRYYRTVGAGRHIVPPWIVVSHVVTVREIPFSAVATDVPTRDDVRIDLDLLLTFTIAAPEKFVFAISAPDFDQVCMAACLDAIRSLIRGKASSDVLDVGAEDTAFLRTTVGAVLEPYGAEIQRVVITGVRPPVAFMASREARRLAAVQRDEQTDRHALEERLLADRESLERQRITAKRERIELEAANETLRLQHLQERLAAYPTAAAYDVAEARLAVARALAGNTRAMVQVGPGGDVADALIVQTLGDQPPPTNARPPRTRSRS